MGDEDMLVAGIIVVCIASILRAWGLLNYKRNIGEAPLIFSGLSGKLLLSIVTTVSIILGLVGAILIGYETSFLVFCLRRKRTFEPFELREYTSPQYLRFLNMPAAFLISFVLWQLQVFDRAL